MMDLWLSVCPLLRRGILSGDGPLSVSFPLPHHCGLLREGTGPSSCEAQSQPRRLHCLHPPPPLPERWCWLVTGAATPSLPSPPVPLLAPPPPPSLCSPVHPSGAQMDRALRCPGILCRGAFLFDYGCPTSCTWKGREKRDGFCCCDAAITPSQSTHDSLS